MSSLIINRVNFLVSEKKPTVYCSKDTELLFRMQLKSFRTKVSQSFINNFSKWVSEKNEDDYIFYCFDKPEDTKGLFSFEVDNYGAKYFKPKWIKEILVGYYKSRGFLIELYKPGIDIAVYEKLSEFNHEWSIYRRFDLIIKGNRNEIIFNVGSEDTFISNQSIGISSNDSFKVIDPSNSYVRKLKENDTFTECRIFANHQLKQQLQGNKEPKKLHYKELYKTLVNFYNNSLLNIIDDYLTIEAGGLKNVQAYDCNKVDLQDNLMLFKKDQTDVNAITGMRDYGPYKTSPKAAENKFIFIYENRDDANKLYLYFKNGLKHFPGLWSYVGIPPTLDVDISFKYSNAENLPNEFKEFLQNKLPSESYGNYFAVIIGHFSRQESDEEQTDLYYYIKNELLKKGIASQFINYKGIREGSFHYFLPNIAIAILAKLGGVPWRLKNKKYDELVIGFNQKKLGNETYIGSAVFFNNEGDLGGIIGYPESNSERTLIRHLKDSIEHYITQREIPPQRLVIHYYKPSSNSEKESIENLIQNELRLNIPFAIIEINDSKTQTDICFDQDFDMGMPESGTYVKVGRDEYLLFNNTRYQKYPLRAILEELPIKTKIHFADTGGFSHRELISQIYEFSRLYWKGLKQRSQPATTIYAKLIADFAAHFDGELPDNKIIHETPWFL